MEAQQSSNPAGHHLISVLIPTYNAPEYFRIALESARAQDYAPLEIIVCDNSTDDRTERMMTASPYADDPRITYVRNRAARTKEDNFAPFEQLVHGDYIQWLMHDDVLLPGKLSKMAAILDTMKSVTLVTSQRDVIDENGQHVDSGLQAHLKIPGAFEVFEGASFGRATLRALGNFIGEPSAVLFRREELAHPYYHAESRGYKRISDVAMWLELMEKGDICVFREPLSSFRWHKEQEGQQPDVIAESRVEWLRLVKDYYARGIYLRTEDDYREALSHLVQDYHAFRKRGWLTRDDRMSPVWKEAYLQTAREAAREIGATLPPVERITSCLIYRDEAPRLQAWLERALTYTDAFVLVDTGATDGSADIAHAFAASSPVPVLLLSAPWHDDFAEARNIALAMADGEWIVFLDADEQFEQPNLVRAVLDEVPSDRMGVQVPVINVDEDADGQEITRFPALRIWRNAKNRRYAGRIHESLLEDGRPLAMVAQTAQLAVRHTGYSTRRLRAKLERNRAMLLRAAESGDEDPRRLDRYLADCCYGLGDYAQAFSYAVRAIEQEPPTVAGQQPLYVLVLAAMEGLGRPAAERLAFARAAHQEHPDWLDITAALGLLAEACGAAGEAEQALASFLHALDAKAPETALQATGASARRGEACRALARIRLAAGDAAGAEAVLKRALELARYDEAALTLYEAACRRLGRPFLATVSALYDEVAPSEDGAPEGRKRSEEMCAFLRGWVLHEGQEAYREAFAPDVRRLTCGEAVGRGVSEMPLLFAALVVGGKALCDQNPLMQEKCAALLPDGMQHVLRVLLGTPGAALTADDADAYLTGFDALQDRCDADVLARYAELAASFGGAVVRQAAEKLAAQEAWGLAFALLQQVAEEEIGDAAAFWHTVGICLYHLHEPAAEECFARAEAAGCTAHDIAAYRAWMKDWPPAASVADSEETAETTKTAETAGEEAAR